MDTCGLFRIAGDHVKLRELCRRVNAGEQLLLHTIKSAHLVAALFKRYLGDLPEPLCTTALFADFLAVSPKPREPSKELKSVAKQLRTVVKRMPHRNREVLAFVLRFLQSVDENEANKMSAHNLALVFGPLLLASDGMICFAGVDSNIYIYIYICKCVCVLI
jgi:RhoGAP domain